MNMARIEELADEAWRKFSATQAWNTQDCTLHIRDAIRAAVIEALSEEPSEAMLHAGACTKLRPGGYHPHAEDIYKSMCAAKIKELG